MTLPRSVLIDPSCTPFYHCTSRCVRRAFLCGKDSVTGYNFEHRRAWLEERLKMLATIFAIELCAYAIMSNHYHVVLYINIDLLSGWTDDEVIDQYRRLHRIPEWFETADNSTRERHIALWRERLGSISWFMKCVNEPLARWANKEDGCKGRFWEGRFNSQAILDEASLLKCMAYVDLNPIRAGVAKTPEESEHTSVKARIEGDDSALAPMAEKSPSRPDGFSLPITAPDYLQLVDYTGRQLRAGKRGRIPTDLPPIIERLSKYTDRNWIDEMRHLTRRYFRAIGSVVTLTDYRDHLGQLKLKGLRT